MITALNGIVASSIASVSYDADAQLFFNAESAAGVSLTLTQKSAINQWVIDAKAAGIWTKMKAVYPIVGGTATSHKFNLKNPLDTNAAFRLVFSGGWTHSATGMLPNGTNAYANTFFAPSVNSTSINSFHNSYYSRTNVNLTQVDSGCGSSDLQGTLLEIRTANITYIRINAATTSSYADTDSLGFYSQSRLSGTQQKGYKNNILKVTGTVNSNTAPSQNFYIGAYNNSNTPFYYSSKECAFASIGDGLTDLESQVFYQITEKYQVALGRNINATQSFYYNSAYNNETNAFLFSTQITDATIQTATNTLVTDLKTAGIYTKIIALYPMVGGTATTNKYNLKDAQDTDASYRLTFAGGWTHSSNGALPNGTNAYANTFLSSALFTGLPLGNNAHLSFYSRTNSVSAAIRLDIGSLRPSPDSYSDLALSSANTTYFRFNNGGAYNSVPVTNTLGFYNGSRTATNIIKTYKNGAIIINGTAVSSSASGVPFFIGSSNNNGTAQYFSDKQCAFASLGDGLTDLESQIFYQIVEKFQVTLGRNVNAVQSFYYNSAYNNETNAFLFSTQITDNTIQTATNTLVADLKTAGVFTKMKAIYPMVGGTATTHKFNLANAQDSNAAFALSFIGGWTHSANGALPNGTNAYADTFFIPSVNGTLNSNHISYYSRTNSNTLEIEVGTSTGGGLTPFSILQLRTTGITYLCLNSINTYVTYTDANSLGFYVGSRTAVNVLKLFKNAASIGTGTITASGLPNNQFSLAAYRYNTGVLYYSSKQCAFASIGDGLTDAEALAYYNAVNAFQVTLGRNV